MFSIFRNGIKCASDTVKNLVRIFYDTDTTPIVDMVTSIRLSKRRHDPLNRYHDSRHLALQWQGKVNIHDLVRGRMCAAPGE